MIHSNLYKIVYHTTIKEIPMTNILKLATLVLLFLSITTGCAKTKSKLVPITNLTNQTIMMKSKVAFKKGVFIKQAIISDCNIQTQLAQFTKKHSSNQQVNLVLNNRATKRSSPYYLDLVITNAISEGNAFLGHRKLTQVKGTLYKNGTKLASFKGQRHSGGGFFAGYKGSCSVLARTVDALGKDISAWLKHPSNNAYLGD
jgi:hypothetical protein